MKIAAYGFYHNGKSSYIKNPWNILDFLIVISSIISLTSLSSKLRLVKMLRIARAFRLLKRSEGLQVALKAILQAIPNILNVTIIMLLYIIIAGIILVCYFKGMMFYCF